MGGRGRQLPKTILRTMLWVDPFHRAGLASRLRNIHPHRAPEPPPPANATLRWANTARNSAPFAY
jgi:hypothetical protein